MNRIDKLFENKHESILSVYFTAGYPALNDTQVIIQGLENAGADLLEIGFPFSDPIADGPVIQKSSQKALENGMNLDILFTQIEPLRNKCRIPIILMGYFNNVFQYGVDKFVEQCRKSGVDGVIIPDLPPEIFEDEYQKKFINANIHFICLISPNSPQERAEYILKLSKGFVYLLSSSSTTGRRMETISKMKYSGTEKLPAIIGFGIHDRISFQEACNQANGAIIGSEFIRRLSATCLNNEVNDSVRSEIIQKTCTKFVNDIRG